ncbi:MAG: MFS transporter [Elusimicrobia bacterium]|nr:MFS transporter [Elusimicrobiota bacterium]
MLRSLPPAPANQWALKSTNAAARETAFTKYSRQIWAWALYDFANSPFTTTITSVVFNVYFAKVVSEGTPLHGDTLWGILVAAATLASGIISPILGALADERRIKKPLLLAFALIGSSATLALTASREGTLWASSIFFFIASVSFSASLTFANAFLNELATEKNIGRISGLGWALGYIGGGLCLAVNLLMIQKPELLGITADNHWPVRLTFASVGFWWVAFTIPFAIWVKEEKPAGQQNQSLVKSLGNAVQTVKKTLRAARTTNANLVRYLVAYLLYNDGIETIIVMAGVFASEILLMGQGEIVSCFLMIQFVAFIGALTFGHLGDRWGNKKALQVSLMLWILVVIWALFMQSKTEFWLAGAAIAIVLGGSQALSRSLFGKLVPRGYEGQFYGFLNLSSKVSATLGPLTYGVSRQITGSPRWAIFSLLIFFVLGQMLLVGVREPSGQS